MPIRPLYICLLALTLCACDEGRVTLSVADAPVDSVDAVVVQFSGVTFVRDDGERQTVTLSPPIQVDLLNAAGGDSVELLSQSIDTGRYRRIELEVDGSSTSTESYVVARGSAERTPLFVPDEFISGLEVTASIDVNEDDPIEATIDFDLRQSLYFAEGSGYELRPKLRFVIDDETGSVGGTVAADLINDSCTAAAIYAFGGNNAALDDYDGTGAQPVNSAIVRGDGADGFEYAIGFLEAGSYTLALTCEADLDEPDQDDDIEFIEMRNVTVRAERATTLNFD
jgi:hypothetical protein